MTDQEKKSGFGGIGDGIRTGLGILGAFKDAVEETLQEAVDRGDLAPERAREAMRDVGRRLQGALDDTRERMELVTRREYDQLRAEVETLRQRVERLEGGGEPPAGAGEGPVGEGPSDHTTPSGIIVTD